MPAPTPGTQPDSPVRSPCILGWLCHVSDSLTCLRYLKEHWSFGVSCVGAHGCFWKPGADWDCCERLQMAAHSPTNKPSIFRTSMDKFKQSWTVRDPHPAPVHAAAWVSQCRTSCVLRS